MPSEKIMKHTVTVTTGLDAVLRSLARVRGKALFVLDQENKVAGTICEQDVRAFLRNGGSMNASAADIMDRNGDLTNVKIDGNGVFTGLDFPEEDGLEIRALTRNDLDAVFDFFDRMGAEGRAFVNHGDGNRIQLIRYLTDGLDNQIHFGAFEKDSGKMVGYVFLIDIHTGVPMLGIAVSGTEKGNGLGQILLEFLDDYAIGQGFGGLMLITSPANIRGQRLYERMGYRYHGIHPSRELLYIKRYPHR